MKKHELMAALDAIKASDAFKARMINQARPNIIEGQDSSVAAEKRSARRITAKWSLSGAFALLFILAIVLLALNNGLVGQFFSGHADDLKQRLNAMVTLDERVYVLRGNGDLLTWTPADELKKITRLPAERIFSDGQALFYTDKNTIYQYDVHTKKRRMAWQTDQGADIALDYASQNYFIYHQGNHFSYRLVDRQNRSQTDLIDRADADFFTLLDATDQFVIFAYTDFRRTDLDPDRISDGLYLLDLSRGALTRLYEGTVFQAAIQDTAVYVLAARAGHRYARDLLQLGMIDQTIEVMGFPGVSYAKIQTFALAGENLIFVTNEVLYADEREGRVHRGAVYRLDLQTGAITTLHDPVGLVDRLFAADHHYCFFDLGDGRSAGSQVIGSLD